MLDDGTIPAVAPPARPNGSPTARSRSSIAAQGDGLVAPLGRVVAVQAIRTSTAQLSWVELPGPLPGKRGRPRS